MVKQLQLCFFLFVFAAYSQSSKRSPNFKQFNITVNFEDYTVKTQMLNSAKEIEVANDRQYLWYGGQRIIETYGGYDGKIIHGTYRAFYLNHQLKEKGEIKYGLRHRTWKYWYANGQLREIITWKHGIKHGRYQLFNDYGQIMATGRFRDNKLHGKFFTYAPNGKIVDRKKYRNGNEVLAKLKSALLNGPSRSVSDTIRPLRQKLKKQATDSLSQKSLKRAEKKKSQNNKKKNVGDK